MRPIKIARLCAVADRPLPRDVFTPGDITAAAEALESFTEDEVGQRLTEANYSIRDRLAVKMQLEAMHKPVKNLKLHTLSTDRFQSQFDPRLQNSGFVPGQVYKRSEASAMLKRAFGDNMKERLAGMISLEELAQIEDEALRSATPETDRFIRQQRCLGM